MKDRAVVISRPTSIVRPCKQRGARWIKTLLRGRTGVVAVKRWYIRLDWIRRTSTGNRLAIREVRKALRERFEQDAAELLTDYVSNVVTYTSQGRVSRENEVTMVDVEKNVDVREGHRKDFRNGVYSFFAELTDKEASYDYTSHPALRHGIEERLFSGEREVREALNKRTRDQVERDRRRRATKDRLVRSYGYCAQCAEEHQRN